MTSGQLPDIAAALHDACRQVDIAVTGARLLRHFANAVFLVDGIVARVAYGPDAIERSHRALTITSWLAELGFPVTVPLADLHPGGGPVLTPAVRADIAVTFWTYYPQQPESRPDFAELGLIARQLHQLPGGPPVDLPAYAPLRSLLRVLDSTAAQSTLSTDARRWLIVRGQDLAAQAAFEPSALGTGLIHADLYSGNLLAGSGDSWLLGDWDSVCIGPREVDLAPTAVARRFGLDDTAVDRVSAAYGFDVRDWPGYPILRETRELTTLSALLRLADTHPDSARELMLRVDSLMSGNTSVRWHRQ